ncbi:hypothetical protein QE152_g37237 [Popillia japonica]|uniref:Uncharacterized protein n=1 Tax=Popillia japonica TaxID=7064 RepID=A0AAW1IAD0_POPJA
MDVKLPAVLKLEGNLSENFRKFKQNFEIYLIASGKDKATEQVKVALLLNAIGKDAVEIFNTFKLSDEEKLKQKIQEKRKREKDYYDRNAKSKKEGEEQVDDRDQEEVNKEIANQRQEMEIENRGEREKRERKLPSRFKDYKLY